MKWQHGLVALMMDFWLHHVTDTDTVKQVYLYNMFHTQKQFKVLYIKHKKEQTYQRNKTENKTIYKRKNKLDDLKNKGVIKMMFTSRK